MPAKAARSKPFIQACLGPALRTMMASLMLAASLLLPAGPLSAADILLSPTGPISTPQAARDAAAVRDAARKRLARGGQPVIDGARGRAQAALRE